MSFVDLIPKKLIFIDKKFSNTDDLFEDVSDFLVSENYVESTFLSAIKEREQQFPTGLPLEKYGVAIPHTDPEHIKEEFVAVIVCKEPVEFKSMENMDDIVNVQLAFILGLKDPNKQLQTLQDLIMIVQDKEKVQNIIESTSASEVLEHLKK